MFGSASVVGEVDFPQIGKLGERFRKGTQIQERQIQSQKCHFQSLLALH
jgi:hypothetical protein